MSENKNYRLNLTTFDIFSDDDKFHIRDQFNHLDKILKHHLSPAEYYFRYSFGKSDKMFVLDDNGTETDYYYRRGRYEAVKDGYICYSLGENVNDDYYKSYDIYFVIKPEEENEFLEELFKKIAEYSLINDYRFIQKKTKKEYI